MNKWTTQERLDKLEYVQSDMFSDVCRLNRRLEKIEHTLSMIMIHLDIEIARIPEHYKVTNLGKVKGKNDG